jgi:hypothetical protein
MAKGKTKLEKMSKDEKTSLAYALATNIAKHGKPQTPKNERKLTKGEENKKEDHVMKFKDTFDLEELKNPKKADLNKDGKLSSYEKTRGAAIEKNINEAPGSTLILSQSDMDKLHKDGKLEIDGHKILFKMNEDLDIGHQDNEPHMLKKDLYRIAKYSAELYKMVDQFDVEGQEVDFPQWWQAKIITSKESMVKAKHYLDGELQVDKIDSMLEEEMDFNDPVLVKQRADKMEREKAANAPKSTPKKSINPNYAAVKNASKIKFLEKEKAQLMRDMEQEAEPEGGPIANEYGRKLNRIDNAITKLRKS